MPATPPAVATTAIILFALVACFASGHATPAVAMRTAPHLPQPIAGASADGSAPGHRCVHDNDDTAAQLYYHGMDHTAPQRMQGRTFQTTAVNGIRFVISTLDVYDTGKVCTAVGQSISNLQGSTVTCEEDDILTDAKRELLLSSVLPQAMAMHTERLRVNPLASNLLVASTSVCPYFTIPSNHTTVGVPDADYVLYVGAAKTSGSTIAWAGFCQLDGSTKRPLVGRVNFGPKYLVNSTAAALDQVVRVGVHEINHALGFSFFYVNNFKPSILTNVTVRGKNVYAINGSASVAAARNFFGCSTLTAVELEDEGGPGTVSSHWERRNHYEDVMSGFAGTFLWYTNVTMGFLYDLGVYFPDFTRAETPMYGKDTGCKLLETTCMSTENPALGWLFCNDTTETAINCSYDHVGFGYCYVRTYSEDLKSYFQYFSGQPRLGGVPDAVDYCPLVLPAKLCTDASAGTNSEIFGTHYGSGSRCMTTNNVIQDGYTAASYNAFTCTKMRCVDGTRLQFALGASAWTDCPTDGSAGTVSAPSGYKGTLVCPKAFHVCRGDDIMFSTTTSTTATPTTTATSTTTTTSTPATSTTATPATSTTATPATSTTATPATSTTATPATSTTATPATSTTATPATSTTATPATSTTATPATSTTATPATSTTATPATSTTATPATSTTATPATSTTATPATSTTATPATSTTATPATSTTATPATSTTATPATSTSTPATTTSAPVASQIVLRLSGTRWGVALAANRSGTESVVRSSIADALNVDASDVELVSVTEGSLVVVFNVVSSTASSDIVTTISTASFSAVEAFYQGVASTTETVAVASVDASSSVASSGGALECSSACIALAILGSVVGAVIVTGFGVWWCNQYHRLRRQKVAQPEHRAATDHRVAPTSTAAVVVDVYQEHDAIDNAHLHQPVAQARHHLYNVSSPPHVWQGNAV